MQRWQWAGRLFVLAGIGWLGGCACAGGGRGWKHRLAEELPALGRHNWIVVADAGFPEHAAAGVTTLATGAGALDAAQRVFAALDAAGHVRPRVYVDAEIRHVTEANAPGIDAYRRGLDALLRGREVQAVAHENLVDRVAAAAGRYRVLVLKTDQRIPYTSVFMELKDGAWSDDAEREIRNILAPLRAKPAATP